MAETTNTVDVTGLPAYTPPAEEGQQQIISTQPQNESEVNVMDYYGVQANQPTLQPSTQLAPQTQQLEIQQGEIQEVPQLGETPTAVAYTAQPTTIAEQEAPEVNLADFQTTTVVDRPEVTYTSAEKSIADVSQAADALQAAQQDLATVDPRATVQGQLALLQKQFEGGETPIWAQGAMRQVSALMAQRGLGSSSVAAEAITNALMQSALPIAQQDSAFYQTVTMQNLANEQQTELQKFNARLTSIFNDQAAENTARNINAASDNEVAQFFANLSQNVALTNTAAYNAMEQFNSTAANQADQFAAELGLRVEELNADTINEMSVFNAEQLNTLSQFNATMKNNREQFQVQNQIAIDASNVQWRRDVNTANTATLNAAIQMDVQNLLGVQQTALNNIWDHYDTLLNFTFKAEESALDRAAQLAIATLDAEARKLAAESEGEAGLISGLFTAGASILSSDTGSSWLFGK
jgi:hypothetical protein